MSLRKKIQKKHIISLILSLCLYLVIALLYNYTNLLEGTENAAYDKLFYFRAPSESKKILQTAEGKAMQYTPNPKADPRIVIIAIDEETIRYEEFEENQFFWPFPWSVHAKVTDFLKTGDPEAIFFDIMFLDHKDQEHILAKSFANAGNVYIDYQFEMEDYEDYSDAAQRNEYLKKVRWPAHPNDKSPEWVKEGVPPVPSLCEAAKGIGFANIKPDLDHINRKFPLYIKFQDYYYPSIDLMLTMNHYGITAKDVEIIPGKYVKLKNIPLAKMTKPNKEQEIKIPIDKFGFMHINFIGGPGSFENKPYYYFYDDGDLEGQFKDKILLVAAYSATGISRDVHKSPYGETFGIEHHANTLNTILQQDFLKVLSRGENLIILLILAIILGIVLPICPIILGTIISAILSLLILPITSYLLFSLGNIVIATALPFIFIVVNFLILISYRVLTEQKEKKYIRSTFSKFVNKSVVDELLKNPEKIKLGGDKKFLTVLFSDIRGFTTISEGLSPEELVEHLNEYLQAMTDIVFEYDGTLDKYVGDEIMAFWGAPIPLEEHALNACKAAIKMMNVLHQLNEKWQAEGKKQMDIGIGLNSGDMVVGNMGSSSRMDYTLMGDNVNLGARLEGTNKIYKTNIIISEYTYELVKDKVLVRELDLIKVKGKEKPVKIYELIEVTDYFLN